MVSRSSIPSLLSHLRLHCSFRGSHARIFAEDIISPSQEFEVGLAQELQKLIHSEGNGAVDLLSFIWICKALDVVISSQASLKHTVETNARYALMTVSSNKVIQQYMEDSVKMLDACCLLKETLAGADAYVKASCNALKCLQGLKSVGRREIQRAKHALLSAQRVQEMMQQQAGAECGQKNVKSTARRLQDCRSMLRRMSSKLPAPPAPPHHHDHLDLDEMPSSSGPNAAAAAIYGGEMCAIFFLRFLSTALSSSRSSRPWSSSSTTDLRLTGHPAWEPWLLALQAEANAEILHAEQNGRHTLLRELHELQASLHQICETLQRPSSFSQQEKDNLNVLVRSTAALVDSLRSSIARLHHQLDCVYASIMETRMVLIDSSTSRTGKDIICRAP